MQHRPIALAVTVLATTLICGACAKPNAANIQLRKQNQELRDKLADLERRDREHADRIRTLESRATTVPVLPQAQLDPLFTTHGLRIGKLTAADAKGLRLYVVPTDATGQPIKAAGSFVVEAFDLANRDGENRIGRWEFPLADAAKHWVGLAMQYTYVLESPWTKPPSKGEVTVRVTFTDALTQRSFTEQKQLKF
jgi:hypothetical protein